MLHEQLSSPEVIVARKRRPPNSRRHGTPIPWLQQARLVLACNYRRPTAGKIWALLLSDSRQCGKELDLT